MGGAGGRGARARFAGHVFDARRDELQQGGAAVPLGPKALKLLAYFLRHPERVLGKEELMAAVWGSTVVTENSLAQLVVELRSALGDREQRIVKTVPRRGYLLGTGVEWLGEEPRGVADAAPAPGRTRLAGVAVALVGVVAAVGMRMPHSTTSVDVEALTALPMFVEALVEDDINGEPSQIGRRIAGDIETQLRQESPGLATSRERAKLAIHGRVLRRTAGGIAVDLHMKDLSSGTSYPVIQASFTGEDELVRSDIPARTVRAVLNRRHDIIVARARRPGHEPDALERLHLAWSDYYAAKTEADLARASSGFQAVLEHDASSVFARLGLSLACLQKFTRLLSDSPVDTLTACERQLRELHARDPENKDGMVATAYVLNARGRPDEAVWLLRKALALHPADPTANMLMAMVLVRQGRFDDATRYLEFTRAVAERRSEQGAVDRFRQAAIYQLFADAAFLQQRDDESHDWLVRWSAEMPQDGRPYLMLAAIDALHGQAEQARSNMARHRELLPRSNLRYVELLYPSSAPAVVAERARLLEGMRSAGLPEGV
jgi:DNA-binding winged helix-turn-helix (wHTH) protein/tetratricopeptide (TPR) repeat protein